MSDISVKHSKANIYEFFFANKKRATYTNLGICLILILIFLLFALRPTILTIGSIKSKISQYEELNIKAEAKIKAGQKLQDEMNLSADDSANGMKNEIDYLNKVFQSDYNMKTVYSNIIQRAKDSNVAIRSIVPVYPSENNTGLGFDTTDGSPSPSWYTLTLSVEGKDLQSVESFVRRLEGYQNFPVLSRVSGMNISNEIESAKVNSGDISNATTKTARVVVCNVQLVIYLDETRYEKPEENIN
jgi:hypothetical protein